MERDARVGKQEIAQHRVGGEEGTPLVIRKLSRKKYRR
jgi:hypothetical protein